MKHGGKSIEETINRHTYIVETPSGEFVPFSTINVARARVTRECRPSWYSKEGQKREDFKIHKVKLAVESVEVLEA